tara:strand:+ start:4221 stop:5645 length:1425 start_codon:yes stop_codon:yes gene_type:complete
MAEVPDLLRLSKVPSNLQQNVETDLIETSTFQEATASGTGFARFDLQQKGFLHSHSKLFLGVVAPAGQGGFAHYPPNIGIGSLVQRAVLKCGNQTLNEIDDWSHLHMIKSAQLDNENNVEREYYTTGRVMNFDFIHPATIAGGAARQPNISSIYGLANGRDKLALGGGNFSVDAMPFARIVAGAPHEAPTYSIDLSDLFPFLKTHSLPLYMIEQQMSVEIHWSPTVDHRVQLSVAKAAAGDYLLDTNELKLCADYIFYDGELMAKYAEANRNLEFSFPDYRLSKSSITDVQLGVGQVRNLGMANRLCSRVLTIVCNDTEDDQGILGKYNSCCPDRGHAGLNPGDSGAVKYNIRYNDRFEFPQALTNKSHIFSHFQKSEGVLFLPNELYADEIVGLPGNTQQYCRRNQSNHNSGLAGIEWMMGTRLTTGRVGVRGIELHLTQENMDGPRTYTVRSYCEYARLAKLEDGFLTVFNA